MLLPSKTAREGLSPALKVPSKAPSLERSFVTVPVWFTTHMLSPSDASPDGEVPAGNVSTVKAEASLCCAAAGGAKTMPISNNAMRDSRRVASLLSKVGLYGLLFGVPVELTIRFLPNLLFACQS